MLSKGKGRDPDNRFLQLQTRGIRKARDHFQQQQVPSRILTGSQCTSFRKNEVH